MMFWKKNHPLKIDVRSMMKRGWIPVLTLDEKWHQLFFLHKKNKEIQKLEQRVNQLLKEQAALDEKYKNIQREKKAWLKKIVEWSGSEEAVASHLNESIDFAQAKVLEINEELEEIQKEIEQVPNNIQEENFHLFEMTIQLIYPEWKKNQEELKETTNEIQQLREKLQEKIQYKVTLEEKVKNTYSYLHDILGAESVEGMEDIWRV